MNRTLEHILKTIPDKTEWGSTTSKQMKYDIINWCGDRFKDKVALEIGSHVGQTTMILGLLFKEVYTINNNRPEAGEHTLFEVTEEIEDRPFYYSITRCNIKNSLNYKFENVYHVYQDAYDSRGLCPNIPNIDVSFIDCLHTYDAVDIDIKNSIMKSAKHIIFDDLGRYKEIRNCVGKYIDVGVLKESRRIGWEKGIHTINETGQKREFFDNEGIICQVV